VTKFYSSSLKAAISVIAPSVVYRYRSMERNMLSWNVAINLSVMAAIMPM
jgi:hypothetical protein